MEKLPKKYGPIFYFNLGYLDHIIISNVEMAMEVSKILDADFASRPHMLASKYVGFDWSNIVFAPYGDHWHLLCKISIMKLFTKTRLKSFEPRHQNEMAYMVENIAKHKEEGKLVEIRHIFPKLTMNNICQMFFGTRHENSNGILKINLDDFLNCASEMIQVLFNLNLNEFIPILKPFELQGLERRMKCIANQAESYLLNILKEYRKGNKLVVDSIMTNLVDILLSLDEKLDDKSMMRILTVCAYYHTLLVLAKCVQVTLFMFIIVASFYFSTHGIIFSIIGHDYKRNRHNYNCLKMGIK